MNGMACGSYFLIRIGSHSAYVLQDVIDGARLWPALVLIEIGLQLLLGLVSVQEKLLARPEG